MPYIWLARSSKRRISNMSWKNLMNVAEATGGSASLTELADRFDGIERFLRAGSEECWQTERFATGGAASDRGETAAPAAGVSSALAPSARAYGRPAPHPRKRIVL